MGYKTHNFLAGAKLSAQSLNEMDEQIKENTDGVALFTMETIVEQIKKLSLTTDGEYIYLYFDSTLINEVPVSDASAIIPCEGMTVTPNDSTFSVQAGEASVTIQVQIAPTDCNQSVRFRSSDINVVNVSSTGVVSGKARGKAVITVICGKYKKEFQVTVWEKFLPDWVAGEYVNAPYTNSGKTGLSVDISTSGKRALSYPYTDQKGIKLTAGETLTGELASERIVIHTKKQQPGKYWKKSFAEVNLCVPNLSENEANTIRLNELERQANKLFDDEVSIYDGTTYRYSIESIGTEADTALKCHYVNVRILFEVLNVK